MDAAQVLLDLTTRVARIERRMLPKKSTRMLSPETRTLLDMHRQLQIDDDQDTQHVLRFLRERNTPEAGKGFEG